MATRSSADVVQWEPVDEEELGVSRRQFLNRAVLGVSGFSAAALGIGILGFLWPTGASGFGGKVNAGSLEDILAEIADKKQPKYIPEAKTYLRPYPPDALPAAKKVPSYKPLLPGMEQGIVALYQRCVHLGCRVPWCQSSQWFECPCHGSKYNAVGEKRDGPAPRGLDRFVVADRRRRRRHRHGRRHHRSADRYQHHQAGAGRAIVHLTPAGQAQAAGPEADHPIHGDRGPEAAAA